MQLLSCCKLNCFLLKAQILWEALKLNPNQNIVLKEGDWRPTFEYVMTALTMNAKALRPLEKVWSIFHCMILLLNNLILFLTHRENKFNQFFLSPERLYFPKPNILYTVSKEHQITLNRIKRHKNLWIVSNTLPKCVG